MTADVMRRARRRPLFEPGAGTRRVYIERDGIDRILPHRPPFSLLDHIDHIDLQQRAIRGRRIIDPHDPILAGHFPGDPVYPGVLLLETVGQLGICLQHFLEEGRTAISPDDAPKPLRLLRIRDALFMRGVAAGDEVTLICQSLDDGDYVARCVGQALVEGEVAAAALFELMFLDSP